MHLPSNFRVSLTFKSVYEYIFVIGDKMVKVKIDKETCIGCGICTATCDEVFELGSDGKASITEKYIRSGDGSEGDVPADVGCVDSAVETCPMNAISKE